MANIIENSAWQQAIREIATDDPVLGGPSGAINIQAKQLTDRTLYLRDQLDNKADVVTTNSLITQLDNKADTNHSHAGIYLGTLQLIYDNVIGLTKNDSSVRIVAVEKYTFLVFEIVYLGWVYPAGGGKSHFVLTMAKDGVLTISTWNDHRMVIQISESFFSNEQSYRFSVLSETSRDDQKIKKVWGIPA